MSPSEHSRRFMQEQLLWFQLLWVLNATKSKFSPQCPAGFIKSIPCRNFPRILISWAHIYYLPSSQTSVHLDHKTMENGPWRQQRRGLTQDPVLPRWMGGLWKSKAIGLVGQDNASCHTLFLLRSLSHALGWRSFQCFKPPERIFPSVQGGNNEAIL